MKAFLLISLYILFGMQASLAADENKVGRLFSTPEQRSYLDALRESKKNEPEVAEPTNLKPVTIIKRRPVVLPKAINVQGFVKRNDGKSSTVWVNGEALQEYSKNKEVQVGRLPKHSNRIPIRLPANGKRLTLKAGQTYHPATNKIRESRTAVQGNAGTIGDANTP